MYESACIWLDLYLARPGDRVLPAICFLGPSVLPNVAARSQLHMLRRKEYRLYTRFRTVLDTLNRCTCLPREHKTVYGGRAQALRHVSTIVLLFLLFLLSLFSRSSMCTSKKLPR